MIRKSTTMAFVWTSFTVLGVVCSPRALAQTYSVTDLGTLGGQNSFGWGINEPGQATGFAGPGDYHAFLWSPGDPPTMIDLGTLPGRTESHGMGINDLGEVVGFSFGFECGPQCPPFCFPCEWRAFYWRELEGMVALDPLPGFANSDAYDINNSGIIVGISYHPIRAVSWENGVVTELSDLGGTVSDAESINELGQIAGWSELPGDLEVHAIRWNPGGGITDLETLGGEYGAAWGINEVGQVVGWSNLVQGGPKHAFLWDETSGMQDLGTLRGLPLSIAWAVNDCPQVVGTSLSATAQDAFVWQNGVMMNLNDLIPPGSGWQLGGAIDINAEGAIVGVGTRYGYSRAFLLTPIATCPDGTIVSADPPDGTHDARQPHPPGDSSPEARQGIGSPQEPIVITLGTPGGENLRCWELCETGREEVEPPTEPLDWNFIVSATEVDCGVYEIVLDRPISGGHWTVITYVGDGSRVSYASLPADANADGWSGPVDILDLIEYLNEVAVPPYGNYSTDIDHSGEFNSADILREIDLLTGAGTFIVWNGKELADNICIGLGGGGGGGPGGDGGGPPPDEDHAFADGFVTYLTTAVASEPEEVEEFSLIVEALTGWCVKDFPYDERAALAQKLKDPSLEFASPVAERMVPDIVAKLLDE